MVVAVVFWWLMVYVSVSCCLEIWGGYLRSFSKGIWVLFMDTCKVWCIWGCIWVFRPCIVQQTLFIGKAFKVKIIHTWHFWNTKIPQPPYKSSLNHCLMAFFEIFWSVRKKITCDSLIGSPCNFLVSLYKPGKQKKTANQCSKLTCRKLLCRLWLSCKNPSYQLFDWNRFQSLTCLDISSWSFLPFLWEFEQRYKMSQKRCWPILTNQWGQQRYYRVSRLSPIYTYLVISFSTLFEKFF